MRPRLQYFRPAEFRQWWGQMDPRTLVLLDVLRHVLGSAVHISKHRLALGRHWGPNSESAHNVDYWPAVMAVDCFVSGVYYRAQAEDVVREATRLGFTGVGVYTDTTNNDGQPQVMFHFDTRPTAKMGQPATWGRVAGKQTTLLAALQSLKTEG